MAECDRPPVGIDVLGIVGKSQLPQGGQRLAGERLVQLHDVDVCHGEPGPVQQLAGCRDGADSHDPRRYADHSRAHHAGERLEAKPGHGSLRCHDHCCGAVVDARRIPGRDGAVVTKHWTKRGQPFQRRVRPGMFVGRDHHRITPALRHFDRNDLLRQHAALHRRSSALLAAERKGVLIRPAHVELVGHVLRRHTQRIGVTHCDHLRVDETPAERRAGDLGTAGERRLRLWDDVGSSRHRLDATRHDEVGIAECDCPGALHDGIRA